MDAHTELFEELAARWADVHARIAAACGRSGRSPDDVEVIAVSKTFPPEVVDLAQQIGVGVFGENRVQEAAWKIPLCAGAPDWHFIGHLQRNKCRLAVDLFGTIHSVDSLKILNALDRVCGDVGACPTVLLEVNVSGERSKHGLAPDAGYAVLEGALACQHVNVEGLMTMAPYDPDPEAARPYFAALRELRERWAEQAGVPLPRLSMGMSGDFEIAIEEGATWVRLGTALFGPRQSWAALKASIEDQPEEMA